MIQFLEKTFIFFSFSFVLFCLFVVVLSASKGVGCILLQSPCVITRPFSSSGICLVYSEPDVFLYASLRFPAGGYRETQQFRPDQSVFYFMSVHRQVILDQRD